MASVMALRCCLVRRCALGKEEARRQVKREWCRQVTRCRARCLSWSSSTWRRALLRVSLLALLDAHACMSRASTVCMPGLMALAWYLGSTKRSGPGQAQQRRMLRQREPGLHCLHLRQEGLGVAHACAIQRPGARGLGHDLT